MTALDEALQTYLQDDDYQSDYYERVLNTDFYIPLDDEDAADALAIAICHYHQLSLPEELQAKKI